MLSTIYLLETITDKAEQWIKENVDSNHQTWRGCIVVEHRYIGPIVSAMQDAGLIIEKDFDIQAG